MELKIPVVIDGIKCVDDLANRVLDEYEYKGRTIREWADKLAHPKTRGDQLRSKTDEELATWLTMIELRILRSNPMLEAPAMEKDWLDWLKAEAE